MSDKESGKRDFVGDLIDHAALTPTGTEEDTESPETAGDFADRPGEDLLESEGEALLPPSEEMEIAATETALPIDEAVLATLDAYEDDDTAGALTVREGELVRQIEDIFPLVWLAMLLTVCYIAIYFAIEQLPNRGNPLPGPDMFF